MAFKYSKAKHKAMYVYIIGVILINVIWIYFSV